MYFLHLGLLFLIMMRTAMSDQERDFFVQLESTMMYRNSERDLDRQRFVNQTDGPLNKTTIEEDNLFKGKPTSILDLGRAAVGDEITITVAVYTDAYPDETGFQIVTADNGQIYADRPAGFIDKLEINTLYTETVKVREGAEFKLTVFDSFGDGLLEPGFVAIFYGTSLTPDLEMIRQTSFKGRQRAQSFIVQQPATPSPSTSLEPSTSPNPTHSPTSCFPEENDGYLPRIEEVNYKPHFGSTTAVFGVDNCRSHSNYADCTNDRRQDCQWQFLGASRRKGVCRVDPVAACITKGNCVCETVDFRGGPADMAGGVLFHTPISVTAADISPFSSLMKYYETYNPLAKQNADHPQDDSFFISRVDFSSRMLTYEFEPRSPVMDVDDFTIAFKIHFLYWDLPMTGAIWTGLGHRISINTADDTITVNGYVYQAPLKKWTCSSIVLSKTSLYVGRNIIPRQLDKERLVNTELKLNLGSFTGELFDVRIYRNQLSWSEIREYGARCTTPDDPAALEYRRDIENPYFIFGCDPDFGRLPADEGGPVPTGNEGQTYGSGPFGTLWMRPQENPFKKNTLEDVPEGEFDEERFFQQRKLQSYLWERYLFEADMIAFNQEPYRFFKSADYVPAWSEKYWNNPCRYLHNFNNGWQYPIYGDEIPKWTTAKFGHVFDLAYIYKTRGARNWTYTSFITHELFHGSQGGLIELYSSTGTLWLAESSAEYGADLSFAASPKMLAALTMIPSYPISLLETRDAKRASHFMTDALSINKWVRGSHIYSSWILWWFLANHAGIPHMIGEMYSNWNQGNAKTAGDLFLVRELVEQAGLDFGDVWATCIAHMRTWDFPVFPDQYRQTELEDFQRYFSNKDIQPPVPSSMTLEGRKTTVELDSVIGTNGNFVAGPSELRPGPNGWNAIKIKGVSSQRYVTIRVRWDDGMGFDSNILPTYLPNQQRGCDGDTRFYQGVVIVHNEATGERRYWKLKGKSPGVLNISTGPAPVTIHIMMIPTPPTDYIGGLYRVPDGTDDRMGPIPAYSYKYSVGISSAQAPNMNFRREIEMQNGIMKFDNSTPGWWPVKCTCLENPLASGNRCVRPTFDFVRSVPQTPPVQSPLLTCFSGESTVQVKSKGDMLIKHLKLGDEVLTHDGKFSRVYSFGHRHESVPSSFLQIHTSQRLRPLEISPSHMVFTASRLAVPASMLNVGDRLETAYSREFCTITKITYIEREGAYAPFTLEGTLIVEGIKASSYVAFQNSPVLKVGEVSTMLSYHWMAHAFQYPQRAYCSYLSSCVRESYNFDGISRWVDFGHWLARWLLKQQRCVILILLMPIILLLTLLALCDAFF